MYDYEVDGETISYSKRLQFQKHVYHVDKHVEESNISFKGGSDLKRCYPKNKEKLGYKLQALAGISGYMYNYEGDGEKGKKGPPLLDVMLLQIL